MSEDVVAGSLTKKILSALLLFIGLGVFVLGGLTWWLQDGNKSSNLVNNLIVKRITSLYPDIDVNIGSSRLFVNYEQGYLVLSVEGFNLSKENQKKFFSAKDLSFNFKIMQILRGNFIPSDLDIHSPKLVISHKDENDAKNFEKEFKDYIANLREFFKMDNLLLLEKLSLSKGDLIYRDHENEYLYQIHEGGIALSIREDGGINSDMEMMLGHQGEEVFINAGIDFDTSLDFKFDMRFSDVSSKFVSKFFSGIKHHNELFNNLKFAGKGEVTIDGNLDRDYFNTSLQISDGYGLYNNKEFFPETVKFDNFEINLVHRGEENKIYMDKLYAKLPGDEDIEFSGEFSLENKLGTLKVGLVHFNMNDLGKYWPKRLFPEVRSYVTSNIRDAFITSSKAIFKLDIDQFEEKKLPEDFVKAEIHFKGMSLNYLDNMPDITNINGMARFDSDSINIVANHGESQGNIIKDAKVTIPFDGSNFTTSLQVEGGLSGVESFVNKDKIIKLSKLLVMEDFLKESKGKINAKVEVAFPIKKDLNYNDIDLSIESKIQDFSVDNILSALDVEKGDFSLEFDGSNLRIDGMGKVKEANPYSLKLNFDLEKDNFDSLTIESNLPAELLSKISKVNLDEYVSGDVGIKFSSNNGLHHVDADLSSSDLNLPNFNYNKPKNQEGELSFDIKNDDKLLNLESIKYKSNNSSLSGKMSFANGDDKKLRSINFDSVKFGKNNFSMTYNQDDKNKQNIKITGRSFDARHINFKEYISKSQDKSDDNISALFQVGTVFLHNNVAFYNFAGNLTKSGKRIEALKAQAKISDQKLAKLEVSGDNKLTHYYTLESDDAGKLLLALDLYEKVKDGKLYLSASSDKNNFYRGNFKITEFSAVKVPFLVNLLTLSSPISSLLTRLDSVGLPFEEFVGSFEFNNKVLSLNNLRSMGPFLSVVADGDIDFAKDNVNISGSMIPTVEGLNEALTKIPLIGKILAGGEDLGVIGTTYTIKGNIKEFKASVNPLSLLAPGFLRKFFE